MNGRLFFLTFLSIKVFGSAVADDAKYHHLKNKILAGPSKLIFVADVPTQGACAILCNAHPNCSHLTLTDDQPSRCELYSGISRGEITDVSGKSTFLRGNPAGTVSASWLMQLNMSAPSGVGFAYWASAVGNTGTNLDITGVTTAQKCFELCQLINKGICWAFNYISSALRCMVPDYTQTSFTHAQRQALMRQTLPEAQFYFYVPAMVAKVTNASISGMNYTMVKDFVMHLSTNWDDDQSNLRLNGIPSLQDCYVICSHSNGNRCRFFSYNEASDMCFVPFDDGTSPGVASLKQTGQTGTTTYQITLQTDSTTNSNGLPMQLNMSAATGAGFAYWAVGVGNTAANLDINVTTAQICFEECQLINKGVCWAFNFIPSASTPSRCVIPRYNQTSFTHAQRQSLVRQTVVGGNYYFYMPAMVAKVTNVSISSQKYTMVKDFVMHISMHWDNSAVNVRLNGIQSLQDCYATCHHTNGNRCRFFSYNEATDMCNIPFDDGKSSAVTSLWQTGQAGTTTYLMDLHTEDITASFDNSTWTAVNDLILYDGVLEGQVNLQFTGMANITMCYRMCIKVLGTCQMFSFKASTLQCFIADANFHDDWTYLQANAGYKSYFIKNTAKAKLITKHIEYAGVNPTTAYNATGSFKQSIPRADMAETTGYTTNNYLKNQLIDYWVSFNTKYKVRIEMRSSSGDLLAWLEQFASGTTTTNWFDKNKYADSSWTDLSESIYWAIINDCRSWYIQRQSGGCNVDGGWFAILPIANCGCAEWDQTATVPMFLYSPNSTYNIWAPSPRHFNVLLVKLIFN